MYHKHWFGFAKLVFPSSLHLVTWSTWWVLGLLNYVPFWQLSVHVTELESHHKYPDPALHTVNNKNTENIYMYREREIPRPSLQHPTLALLLRWCGVDRIPLTLEKSATSKVCCWLVLAWHFEGSLGSMAWVFSMTISMIICLSACRGCCTCRWSVFIASK